MKLSDLPMFVLLGQLGISAYFWLQYTGLKLTNAGVSGVLAVSVIPLATMVISGLTLGESLTWRRTLTLTLGVIGIGVVISQQGLDVSLETGQFGMPPAAAIGPAAIVRFRKSFTSFRGRDIGDRTVFVVAATALAKFLTALEEVQTPPEEGRLHFQMVG